MDKGSNGGLGAVGGGTNLGGGTQPKADEDPGLYPLEWGEWDWGDWGEVYSFEKGKGKGKGKGSMQCWGCGGFGHRRDQCPKGVEKHHTREEKEGMTEKEKEEREDMGKQGKEEEEKAWEYSRENATNAEL